MTLGFIAVWLSKNNGQIYPHRGSQKWINIYLKEEDANMYIHTDSQKHWRIKPMSWKCDRVIENVNCNIFFPVIYLHKDNMKYCICLNEEDILNT